LSVNTTSKLWVNHKIILNLFDAQRHAPKLKDVIKNRIKKNLKKLKKLKTEAIRVYDRDIPEFPFIIEEYGDDVVIWDKGDGRDRDREHFNLTQQVCREIFKGELFIKERQKMKGSTQYEKLRTDEYKKIVSENNIKFVVNLSNYLDTGLFLDHRPMRVRIKRESEGKRLLNLFCYTGSVSVYGALGGAKVTSMDMSQTYIYWAIENFNLNHIDLDKHEFITANCLEYLKSENRKFDLIFLDPPTFSNSKKMKNDFEVEEDQDYLVNHCMRLLRNDGVLYFSTNKRSFKLNDTIRNRYNVEDLSLKAIPIDYHDKKIHYCFKISFMQ